MTQMQRCVEFQPCVEAAKAVVLRRELDVVPGRKAFQLGPADPAGGERTFAAAGLELGCRQHDLRPGGGRLVRIHAGCLESVLVVMEYRRRAVERHAQHLPARRGVVAGDCRYIGAGVEFDASEFHHFADRLDRTLAGHHGGSADFEDLQDMWRVAGPESGHRSRHRFVIAALVRGRDLVVFLAGIEFTRQVVDPVTESAPHRMPPLDFSLGLGLATKAKGCRSDDQML